MPYGRPNLSFPRNHIARRADSRTSASRAPSSAAEAPSCAAGAAVALPALRWAAGPSPACTPPAP
eukprot:1588813-Lingulodinium_polyedra.AAC.1